ncbi:Ca2+ regulator and membrane fusion protein Fig1-domain-containing protein [Cercophora newfieldiana]|uniref:Ca2+ regulator and membrane fusion protein Fig1-domain-containing protein n=1 Tax=Cercophora newfieldiana TaxID=92897 RepID=A0AA39XR88_9PEZI|nr:Ca2+ regulator and membrane fusion protein Fig1-domain-containing protein [Cercophora newfieldiana]
MSFGSKFKPMQSSTLAKVRDHIHHILMLLTIASTILLSVLLAGCSSPGNMSSIYVLALSYQKTPHDVLQGTFATTVSESISTVLGSLTTAVEVRAGYFNICISRGGGEWECGRDAPSLQARLSGDDPLNLVTAASTFRDHTIFSGLLATQIVLHSIALITLAMFDSWHKAAPQGTGNLDPFPTRSLGLTAQLSSGAAALFGLLSAVWQHAAAVTAGTILSTATYGHVVTHVGAAATTLVWASYFLLMFVFIVILGMRVQILAQSLGDRMEEE